MREGGNEWVCRCCGNINAAGADDKFDIFTHPKFISDEEFNCEHASNSSIDRLAKFNQYDDDNGDDGGDDYGDDDVRVRVNE